MTKGDAKFFGERLKNIRERKNISVEELSSYTGLCQGYIENLERGYVKKLQFDNWKQMLHSLETALLDYQ